MLETPQKLGTSKSQCYLLGNNTLVRDNQQATSWFVGILEGEGSYFRNRFQIHNNDVDIIKACETYLTNNYVLFNTYKVKAGNKSGYKIIVSGQDCVNLYNRILPHLQCRRKEFQQKLGASETACDLSVDDLHWLVGIWEAEGSFIITKNCREHLTLKLELDNTNDLIIRKIVLILEFLNCSWYVRNLVPETRKMYTKITIQGLLRCKRFLEKTKGLWKSSRNVQRSSLMLEYISSRLKMPKNEPYTASQLQSYNTMQQFNR